MLLPLLLLQLMLWLLQSLLLWVVRVIGEVALVLVLVGVRFAICLVAQQPSLARYVSVSAFVSSSSDATTILGDVLKVRDLRVEEAVVVPVGIVIMVSMSSPLQ